MNLTEITVLIPVITGLVSSLTSMGLDKRFAPIASVVVSIGLVFLYTQTVSIPAFMVGLITGLSACGLYSGVKKVYNG